VVLKISIDETGKVISASVYRSSGSIHIDQPCQLAAYEWWFEPLKDKSGKLQKDVILFAISFVG
jgi:TonB family protein